jgi:hypothetical protein
MLEGFQNTPGLMRSTLYNAGKSNDPTATDTVTITLWNPVNLQSAYYSVMAILHNNGLASVVLPPDVNGGSYYLSISHRNSIGVWSVAPVIMTQNTYYNFSDPQNCYSNGSNAPLKSLTGGGFGLYSGDINGDGGIDLMDLQAVENEASFFVNGYRLSDCDGNLYTDITDLQLAENNAVYFIYTAHP